MMLNYPTRMNIAIVKDGKDNLLPDPSSWKYQVGDLDTSGKRDAKGKLHRAYVATKINYEFEWNALEWEELAYIIDLVQRPKFRMRAPDPRNFNRRYSGNFYVGDRTGDAKYYLPDKAEKAVFDLKLKFIEY